MPKLTDAERDDARRLAASFSAWGRPIGDMARYLARAVAELEALRATTKAMREADAICDQVYEDTMAEHDRG